MSNLWITWVLECSPTRRSQRQVLTVLADHADDDGRSFPSVAGLASRCGLSERQTQKTIRALIQGGALAIVEAGGGTFKRGAKGEPIGRRNVYQIVGNLDDVKAKREAKRNPKREATYPVAGDRVSTPDIPRHSGGHTPSKSADIPRQKARHTPSPVTPEPPFEPSAAEPSLKPKGENRFANLVDAAAEREELVGVELERSPVTRTASPAERTSDRQATGPTRSTAPTERERPTETTLPNRTQSRADRYERLAAKLARSADRWKLAIPQDVRTRIEQIEAERFELATKKRKSDADGETEWRLSMELVAIRKNSQPARIEADRRGSAKFNAARADKARQNEAWQAEHEANFVAPTAVRRHALDELRRAGADEAFASTVAAALENRGRAGIAAIDAAVAKLADQSGITNPGGWLRQHFRREGWIATTRAPRVSNRDRHSWRASA